MTALPKHKVVKKLPVPYPQRCNMQNNHGQFCERRAEYIVTRVDATKFKLCGRCALKLRDLHEDKPLYYHKLRFVAINKREDAS